MRERRFDLLVVGELNPDAMLLGASIEPEYGQVERLVDGGLLTVGSSGAIVACGAARLGMRTAYVGVVGDDPAGRMMLGELGRRGIDIEACRIDPNLPTGLSVVLSTGADRAILTHPGAMSALTADDVGDHLLAATRHLHISSPHLQAGLASGLGGLLAKARTSGATTSIDPGWDPTGTWGSDLEDALEETDIFLPNAAEACRFARADDPEDALRSLAERIGTVVVKLGAAGAIASRGGEAAGVAAPEVASIDGTGAGDSFAAGFFCGLGSGGSLPDALAFAVACGSLSTRALGGVDAQPDLDEATDLAAELEILPTNNERSRA